MDWQNAARNAGNYPFCASALTCTNPAWDVKGFDPFVPGGIASHHIIAGTLGILAGIFHLSIRLPQRLYKELRMKK